ncbi:DUF4328 domain-containing protein [Kitasatospora sp. NPDC089797]|uniref:DUF4328 domain-containing protein n=1 Tax=Kitasatospora sp. NPDC089797 TaxID=3155298 RepID=UPI0034298F75
MGTDSGRCFGCAEAAPGWAAQLNPANGLAVALCVLLGLSAVVAALSAAVDVWVNVLIGGVSDGPDGLRPGDLDTVESAASTLDSMSGAFLLLGLATIVVFVVWFHRIRRNADLLAPNGHRLGRGWSIGAWFTPVVLLWFPYQLTVDCWRASAPLDAEGRRRTPSEKVLVLWWSTWIGSLIVSRIAATMTGRRTPSDLGDLGELGNRIWVEAAGSVLRLVAAIAAIVVVHRLTAMQRARRADVNPLAARLAQEARVRAVVAPPAVSAAPVGAPQDAAPAGPTPA